MPETTELKEIGWSILELFGHRRLGGYLTEEQIAGAVMLRIDVPGDDAQPAATQWYTAAAVYAITPTTEEIARLFALRNRPRPVHQFELPAAPPHPSEDDGDSFRDDQEGPF